jgi:hypothetical protein
VPHFLGLHALQILPLLTLVARRRPERVRVGLVIAAGASYTVLFAVLLWQALRGEPLTHPDALSVGVFAAWATLTVGAVAMATLAGSREEASLRTRS